MNRKYIIILVGIICTFLLIFGGFKLYQYLRIKFAKIEVVLVDDLTLEFNEERKLSSYIKSMNGNLIQDKIIKSTKLGKEKIKFYFINNQDIKVSYTFDINVVDTTAPLIWLGNKYNVKKGTDIDLTKKILCGDIVDSNPTCIIEGEYNLDEVGNYQLTFKATDKSGNVEEQPFTLNVYEPVENKPTPDTPVEEIRTNFSDVVATYKNENTRIGIDVSKWQKDIDFSKLKEQGVEFIMIRVGGTLGSEGEYFLDTKFEENIKEANKYGIDVGIYFYSYANSTEKAKKDAKWVLKQIKDYKVNLPIAFDWEEWSSFNEYNLSFFDLTSIADAFLDEVEKAGYEGMLYSSKTYLDNIWLPTKHDIWLAHYTDKTTYQGKFKMWQLCDNGKVDGIDTHVDIDILYEKG